ncbi:hypothetical protein [Agromyces aerolatus]|uniref:hypothetical protein n=1 Tax=Agromyces sp. LY-1074 TaxID=3074080 RepID=UPI0028598089|nr:MULTISPECIES: hypothetical protein [unclassified Agromyces]MDR5699832.1 hypothetical protein [Agromyces sp. LY-1074]MDR5706356.1 hypothetical protein [Agromyces sp. LY-1358]
MRWDLLFDDLASQLDLEQRAEERALALEEERLRLSRLGLRERLQALSATLGEGGGIRVHLRGGTVVSVRPAAFGRDWLSADLVERAPARSCILPLSSVAAVVPDRTQIAEPGIDDSAGPASPGLVDRISLSFVLRDLCRRRTAITVTTEDGDLHGTLDRVARDHIDLALHEPGVPRREQNLQGYRIVPFERLRLITFR